MKYKVETYRILNLGKKCETLKMEFEYVKEFIDWLLKVVNQIRVLGEELKDQRIVEKVLQSLSEKFESKIYFLKESQNLSEINILELINVFQATAQKRQIRNE